MIERLIGWCAHNRFLVFTGTVVLTVLGVWAMTTTPLDAVPDISDVQVIVSTEWTGRSPDLIEDQITYPIVTALISAPRVQHRARLHRLRHLLRLRHLSRTAPTSTGRAAASSSTCRAFGGQLPAGREPDDRTGRHRRRLGLRVRAGRRDRAARPGRAAQLAGLVSALLAGVRARASPRSRASAASSSSTRSTSIRTGWRPTTCRSRTSSTRSAPSNNDVEGRLLEFSGREYMVRGRGYLQSIADIEKVSLGADPRGTPVRVARRRARCGSGRTSAAASPNSTARAKSSAASS